MDKREPGYYWVFDPIMEDWSVAYWDTTWNGWSCILDPHVSPAETYSQIGPRIEPPEEQEAE